MRLGGFECYIDGAGFDMHKCITKGHKFVIEGWDRFGGQPDLVFIRCKRCGRSLVTEVVKDQGGVR